MVIKGMNYSPVPIGALPGNPPYGDYLTPEYMNVWLPDIESMRAAGVNAIKLYAGNPALNAGAPGSSGNWKQFLDTCYNAGTNPVYVVMFSYVQGDVIAAGGASYDQYLSDYENLVSSTVNHPAILGYCVGNEIFGGDVTSNPQFWINFGALLNRAKQAGQSQGATAFLMTATNDNYTPTDAWPAIKQGESSGQLNNLDAWGINIYRGPLFGGAGNSAFVQYKDLMTSLNKTRPLILGGGERHTPPAPSPFTVTTVVEGRPLIWTLFLRVRWDRGNHSLMRCRPRNSWRLSGRLLRSMSARDKSAWVGSFSSGVMNTGKEAMLIRSSAVPARAFREGRLRAATGTKRGSVSAALSISPRMDQGSRISAGRPLRRMLLCRPSTLERRRWAARFTANPCSVRRSPAINIEMTLRP